MGRSEDKVWYLMRADARRGPFSATELRRFGADHGMEAGDTFTRDGLEGWHPISVLAEHVVRYEAESTAAPKPPEPPPRPPPTKPTPPPQTAPPSTTPRAPRSTGRLLMFGCGGLLGLVCLGVCGGAGVWALTQFMGDEPRFTADSPAAEAEPDPVYLTALTAEADELIAGASTDLTASLTGGRFPQAGLWLEWQHSCGAVIVDPTDSRKARFFAPNDPGWCTLDVELHAGLDVIGAQRLSLLITPETAALTELNP